MSTAIDTNVIVALWDANDVLHRKAREILDAAASLGALVIAGVVYAELIAAPGRSEKFVDRFCEDAALDVDWELGEKIWRSAGNAYQGYAARRREQKSGEARRILADFLIGAHALVNGYRLLTLDARAYQRAFPKLAVLAV